MPLPCPASHLRGEFGHAIEHLVHLIDDVHTVDADRRAARRAQGNMQNGAVLRDVDTLAAEHRIDALAQSRLFRELGQQREGLVRDAILRVAAFLQ